MRWMRSTWLMRGIALLLAGATLSALWGLPSATASGSASTTYAAWLRAQLRTSEAEDVDRALEEAVATNPATLGAFVEAFVAAYEARHPQESAARFFTDRDLSNAALITYLQRRYTEIAAEAVLPRLRFAAAANGTTLSTEAVAALRTGDRSPAVLYQTGTDAPRASDIVDALRTPTPAQPQGP